MKGCGSHSCMIEKPEGMGTNSRCQCPAWKLHREIMRLRKGQAELLDAAEKVARLEIRRWPNPPKEWLDESGKVNNRYIVEWACGVACRALDIYHHGDEGRQRWVSCLDEGTCDSDACDVCKITGRR